MHWNYPQGNNSGSGGSNSSFRPQNELVANRQKNQAGIWNGDVKSIISVAKKYKLYFNFS